MYASPGIADLISPDCNLIGGDGGGFTDGWLMDTAVLRVMVCGDGHESPRNALQRRYFGPGSCVLGRGMGLYHSRRSYGVDGGWGTIKHIWNKKIIYFEKSCNS